MNSLTAPSKFFFFKTKKEKVYVMRSLRKGNPLPLLLYLLYRARLSSFLSVKRKYYTIKLSYSPYALWLYFHPNAVRKEEEFVHFFLEEGDVFVDAGAHLGTVSLTASHKVKGGGKVIAIEPHPRTVTLLQDNIQLSPYKNITVRECAVSNAEGLARMTNFYVGDMNHLAEEGVKQVKVLTLETLLSSVKKVWLLKVDVEGLELMVLQGLGKEINKVSAILFESAEASFERYGYTLGHIIYYLESSGFSVYYFPEASEKKIKKIGATHRTRTRYEDLLALTGEGKIRFQKQGGKILPF